MENPFAYERPARSQIFSGRKEIVRSLLSRARTGQSTALVGEPKMGKTSTLKFLADVRLKEGYGDEGSRNFVVDIDAHLLGYDCQEDAFWAYLCRRCKGVIPSEMLRRLEGACTSGLAYDLEEFFLNLGEKGKRIVLLIDEFDSLLFYPGLASGNLFCALRILSSSTHGLALVTSSRMNVIAMNRRGEELRKGGSPLFNYLDEQRLPPFSVDDISSLVDNALRDSAISLSDDEIVYLGEMSGGLPYLVQLMAWTLFEAHTKREPKNFSPLKNLLTISSPYFDEIWSHRSLPEQQALTLLALEYKGGYIGRTHFRMPDFRLIEEHAPQLRVLQKLGLVKLSQGAGTNRWEIGSILFCEWLALALENRTKMDKIDSFLSDRKQGVVLTIGQWKRLWTRLKSIPFKGLYEVCKNIPKFWLH